MRTRSPGFNRAAKTRVMAAEVPEVTVIFSGETATPYFSA